MLKPILFCLFAYSKRKALQKNPCLSNPMGYKAIVGLLLQNGAKINIKNEASGRTALHIASLHNHKDIMELLLKLPEDISEKIQGVISNLAYEPRPSGCAKLYDGNYRIRVGRYRVIYEICDKKVIVKILEILHRKDAYRIF